VLSHALRAQPRIRARVGTRVDRAHPRWMNNSNARTRHCVNFILWSAFAYVAVFECFRVARWSQRLMQYPGTL
jgi:hypothetical protein